MFNKFSYVCDYGLPVSDIHSILDIIFLFAQIIYVLLGIRSLANASRARQFNPLNPPGVGWVPLPQTNMAAVVGRVRSCAVVRGRACVVGHAWSCAVAAHDCSTHPTPWGGVGTASSNKYGSRGRSCAVVRGRACVAGHARSCAVGRAWSVVRGRPWSCGRAVLPASRPALPWHERTNNI